MVGLILCSIAFAPRPPAADPTAAPTTPPTGPAMAVPMAAPAMPAAAAPRAVAPATSGCPCASPEGDRAESSGGTFFTSSLVAMRTRLAAPPPAPIAGCRETQADEAVARTPGSACVPLSGRQQMKIVPRDRRGDWMTRAVRLLACLFIAAVGCTRGAGEVVTPLPSTPDAGPVDP